ncbi:PD-(D/E)XK nuclease family protein [Devosia albogilva]|uniref:PD-(D/E)XK nuclease family protein n=1 Tax=Devosia albogilva TaxID=429726 RepID=A0ABW5QLB7_9HYPH
MSVAEPSLDEFEHLFVNNEGLDRLGAYLGRFNPIRTMRMEGMEVRHSAILAWLLDPSETHGFSDRFLKAFLAQALRGRSACGRVTAIDVVQSDLRDAQVHREWQNIDIFILSRRNNWAFVIENKFYASQHEGQLAKYAQKVRAAFSSRGEPPVVCGIFLTLLDELPQDESFAPIRYSAICDLLPRLMALEGLTLGQEVSIFLEHYLEIVREAAGMSEERVAMEALARQLYRTHKKVLDFVMEYGASTDFVLAAETVFEGTWEPRSTVSVGSRSYRYNGHNNRSISFLPVGWVDSFEVLGRPWRGCEQWWAGYPLICWLELLESADGASGTLKLFAEVGPLADHSLRSELIGRIRQLGSVSGLEGIRFQNDADKEGKRYSKFLRNNAVVIDDLHNAEEISKGMVTLLDRLDPYFEAIAGILPEFVDQATQTL